MIRVAILIDGGFYRKRAKHMWGEKTAEARAAELNAYCMAHLNYQLTSKAKRKDREEKDGKAEQLHYPPEPCSLYRIFYYDCAPVRRSVYHPLLKKEIRLENTDTFEWTTAFFSELKKMRKFALRLGTLATSGIGYNLKPSVTKKLLSGFMSLDDIDENHFDFVATQKGVDMRIGVDIASMAFKRQVDQIILIAGDSDFVPAAKLARREGVDFILDPMHQPVKDDLNEHIDGKRSLWKPSKSNTDK